VHHLSPYKYLTYIQLFPMCKKASLGLIVARTVKLGLLGGHWIGPFLLTTLFGKFLFKESCTRFLKCGGAPPDVGKHCQHSVAHQLVEQKQFYMTYNKFQCVHRMSTAVSINVVTLCTSTYFNPSEVVPSFSNQSHATLPCISV
jgi:hypothetical protein